jgi:hypothetical protein
MNNGLGYIVPQRLTLNFTDTLAKAVVTLTSDATNPDAGGTFVLGSKEYELVSSLTAGVEAEADLTTDETEVADGTQVVVGSRTYTIVETLPTYDPYDTAIYVLIGADADETLDNLADAINGDSSAWGVTHSKNNSPHPDVEASAVTSHVSTITALVAGEAGNDIALTSDDAHLVAESATLEGGVDTVPNEIVIGGSAAVTLDNIKAAVNAEAGIGTTYSLGTTANEEFEATTNGATTQVFQARTGGVAGNSLTATEDATHLSFGSVAGGGGTVASAPIGNGGGYVSKLIFTVPQLAGTPTLTPTLVDSDGNTIATIDAVAENDVSIVDIGMVLRDADTVVLTASSTVEDNLDVIVEAR